MPSAGSSVPPGNYCKELSSQAPHTRPALIIFPWGGVPEGGHRTPRPRREPLCLGVGGPLSEVTSRRVELGRVLVTTVLHPEVSLGLSREHTEFQALRAAVEKRLELEDRTRGQRPPS